MERRIGVGEGGVGRRGGRSGEGREERRWKRREATRERGVREKVAGEEEIYIVCKV